ncbi:MAG TPA: hypothetical protein PLU17_11390 [Chitinophagaceae bacterium]|nr:hypothetical protein [Chitinophagaceae bacterium]
MKQITLLLSFVLLIGTTWAQVPQKFNYQGIARDAKGNALSKQMLSLKLTILPTIDASIAEYEETQIVTTNEFGLYTLQIGNGTPTKGEMKLVKWETGNKYIKVAIDPIGGSNYIDAGTTQLLSVPYAIYADKAGIARETINGSTSGNNTRASGNYIEKTSVGGVVNSNSQLFDNGAGVALGFASPIYTFESRKNSNTDWCIRTTNPAGTSRSAFRIQNEDSTLGEINFVKFGKSYGGTFMGISRNNMAGINSLTGPFVLNCGGDMIFGNSLTVSPFTQTPRMTINGTTGNVGFGLPLGGVAAARVEVNGQIKINGGAPGLGKVLTSDANGLATWQTPTGGGSGSVSGTTNYLAKFTSGTAVGNSQIFDNGTSVGIGTITPGAKLEVAGQVKITGGTPGLGKVLTSDANGLADWQTPSNSSPWIVSGNNIYNSNTANVGVGNINPQSRLHVTDATPLIANGIIRGEFNGTIDSTDIVGVLGINTVSNGQGIGVKGQGGLVGVSGSSAFTGVLGSVTASNTGYGVYGDGNTNGTGVYGFSVNTNAVDGFSLFGNAINAYSTQGIGVNSLTIDNSAGYFAAGSTTFTPNLDNEGVLHGEYVGTYLEDAVGVFGKSTPATSFGIGVYGVGNSVGVFGSANGGPGYAGYFVGPIYATTASSGIKTFKIDHPTDPSNKYLYHSSIESNDMMNIYNGNITTDANGDATVQLPSYFEALNKDYKYQLTVIGTFAQAIIGEEVMNNQFKIKTNQPNVKVSWQVTGVRNDAMAKAHPVKVEVDKEGREKGKYLNPIENGRPISEGIIENTTYSNNTEIPVRSFSEQERLKLNEQLRTRAGN